MTNRSWCAAASPVLQDGPTRHLYAPRSGIREVQVESSDLFHEAHTRYWKAGGTAVQRAAPFILGNAVRT